MKIIITTSEKRVEVSDIVVDKLPSVPPSMTAIANKLGFNLDDLRAKGFDIKDTY